MSSAMVALLGVAGCSSSTNTSSGQFPALAFDAGEVTNRGTENVIFSPVLDDDDNFDGAIDVTAFGETIRFTREDFVSNNVVASFQNGSTIAIVGVTDDLLDAAEQIVNQSGYPKFQNHFSGFVVRIDGDVVPQENMDMVLGNEAFGISNSQGQVREDVTDIVAVNAGNETGAEDLGGFILAPDGTPLTASYNGPAALVDGKQGVISGDLKLQADFTNEKVGGYISNLRNSEIPLVTENGGIKRNSFSSVYSDGPSEQIRINETDIVGNGFQTDLDLVRGAVLGDDGDNLLNGNLQNAEAVEGFFTESEVNGTFFGESGEEVSGTIAYTRSGEEDFDLGNQKIEIETLAVENEAPQPEPVEGIGVFSGAAKTSTILNSQITD